MERAPLLGFETLTLETKDGVALLTLNRPSYLNALNLKTLEEISDVLCKLDDDLDLVALIVTGAGPKAFAAGADVAAMERMTPTAAIDFSKRGQDLFLRIERFPVPTVAAVNGYALGGGNELAMACDIRIAAKNARFGQPEVGLGITPGFGGTQRLPRLVGKLHALDLLMTGRVIDADEALRIGLVNRVVPEGGALTEAMALAVQLAKKSSFAVRQVKKAILEGSLLSVEDGLLLERRLFSECFGNPDQKEGMRAFLEKRAPEFKRS